MNLLLAVGLGMVGSLHCVGMCMPLQLWARNESSLSQISFHSWYQGSRMVAYAILGILAGLLGEVFVSLHIQYVISVITGLLLLVGVLLSFFHVHFRLFRLPSFTIPMYKKLKQKGIAHHIAWPMSSGLLNGFLPCGMVYIALAMSFQFGTWQHAALFMLLFGLGAVPALLISQWAGRALLMNGRISWVWVQRSLVLVAGAFLLMRGLDIAMPLPHLPFFEEEGITSCE